ncbi:MAG TPA: Ppx/GppA phosphatase family protein [Thermoplasmata archaeon]|nr:Ppx/GppA phosphatase family protein [Thermoplasmata archaeon]
MPSRSSRQLGVIDVGSNTARFVVFESSAGGTVRAVHEAKEVPRLGLGAGPDGRLSDEAIQRGVAGVKRFARLVRSLDVPRTLAVATSAVRDAPNGPEFVRAVERSSGVLLRIISGVEEARYGYLGVASAWELREDIVCDLGGGSLQLVEVHRGALRNSVSLPLGVLRLSQRFLEHDPPKRREMEELRDYVRETLASVFEAFQGETHGLYAVGGTVRSLARAAIDFRGWPIGRVHGYPLLDHDVEALGELLGEMPADKRRAIPGVGSDRADVVLAGIVVFRELMRVTRAEQITVSGTGIREGIALEAVGAKLPASAVDLAQRSVAAASESFRFDGGHGREVTDCALGLFAVLADRFHWGTSEELALRVAAGMHDAGTAIDIWRHAHHSAYLIQNYPILGLNQREILLASMAAYVHEGSPLPTEWKKGFQPILTPDDLDTARELGAVVEVAELTSPFRPRFSASGDGRSLGLAFSPPSGTTVRTRLGEKVAKTLQRAFDVEVRVRDS